jgi:hypothetical protein
MATQNKTWDFTGGAQSWSPTTVSPAPTMQYANNRLEFIGEIGRNKFNEGYFSITGTFASIFNIDSTATVNGYTLAAFSGGCLTWVSMIGGGHSGSSGGAALYCNDGTARDLIAAQADYTGSGQTRTPSVNPGISGLSLPATTSVTFYVHFHTDNDRQANAGMSMYVDNISVTIEYTAASGQTYTKTGTSDIATVSDNTLRRAIRNRLQSDTLSLTDSALRRALFSRRADESVALTDQGASAKIAMRVVDDGNIVVYDSGWKLRLWECLGLDETLDMLWDDHDHTISQADYTVYTLTGTSEVVVYDDVLKVRHLSRTVADTAVITDEILAAKLRARLATDGFGVADAILRSAIRGRLSDDSITLTDSSLRYLIRQRQADDALLLIDDYIKTLVSAGALYVVTKSDTLELYDELRRQLFAIRVEGDAITLTDSFVAKASRSRTVDEVIVVLDAFSRAAIRQRIVSEELAVTDNVLLRSLRNRIYDEAIGVTDQTDAVTILMRALSDALSVSDDILYSTVGVLLALTIDDSLTVSDAMSRRLYVARQVDDRADVTDAALKTIEATRQDAISLSDAYDYGRVYGRVASDTLTLSDSVARFLHRVILMSESVTVADGFLTARLLLRDLPDVFDVTDAFTADFVSGTASYIDIRVRLGVDVATRIVIAADKWATLGVNDPVAVLGRDRVATLGRDDPDIELGAYN